MSTTSSMHKQPKEILLQKSETPTNLGDGTKRVVFIRHGQSEGNVLEKLHTREEYLKLLIPDVALTEQGKSEARAVRERFVANGVFSSPQKSDDESETCSTAASSVEGEELPKKEAPSYKVWASPMQRTIQTAKIIFDGAENIDEFVPAAREYFPREGGFGSNCEKVTGYIGNGKEFNCEEWEKQHGSEDHINDANRMDELHERILNEKADDIFVVCHWGTINNYLNRFCTNIKDKVPTDTVPELEGEKGWEKCETFHCFHLKNCEVKIVEYEF